MFLKKHQIPYETILQYPGDCVYVAPGVFHQVINLTPNAAEAINYAPAFWNFLVEHLSTCICDENRFAILPANPDVLIETSIQQFKAYLCTAPECNFVSWDKPSYKQHVLQSHPGPSTAGPIYCFACKFKLPFQRPTFPSMLRKNHTKVSVS
ncbi:hypothetical protein QAD02_014106 [Eretmocerus hayati]|uniref:Uncharacterized protein n=1 Tax=Eretmocerus hayati TaxID=131215 RepID=A0ACC2P6U9_9HYME|nr:hypothetical protein QAD02_014106 [Eretmocerus hayati]